MKVILHPFKWPDGNGGFNIHYWQTSEDMAGGYTPSGSGKFDLKMSNENEKNFKSGLTFTASDGRELQVNI